MNGKRRSITIDLMAGEPRRTFCDRCNTSAGYEVDVLHLAEDGPRPLGRTISGCVRCDER